MAFLLILIALLIARFSAINMAGRSETIVHRWCASVGQAESLSSLGGARLYIILALPVLILTGLLVLIHGAGFQLAGHLLGLLVLLYCFGATGFVGVSQKYLTDLKRDDVQGAYHDAESVLNSAGETENWQDLHRATLTSIGWKYFQCYFPPLFWFVVVGAPGALLYRLMTQVLASADNDSDVSRLKVMLRVVEWLPLRLCGLTLAFVGRWEPTFRQFMDSLTNLAAPSAAIFLDYINAAINGQASSGAASNDSETALGVDDTCAEVGELEELPHLIDRALVMWLAIIGLAAVL